MYLPRVNETPASMLLFVTGGAADDSSDELGLQVANAVRAPCAILFNIPNQPLLGDKYEDDLIAETFVRFLQTADEDWPLLLPMTKSAVKAMDVLQAFAAQELQQALEGFVLTGASKRGWTSWLAAAVDPRVKGVVPRVFDMLNIPAQLPHQLESWGSYSEMLRPYVQPGLPGFLNTPGGRRLVEIVDPYAYRTQLGMPKLIILGTNDRYWTLDALNLFWRDLPGSKYIRYVPNAGHGLRGAWHMDRQSGLLLSPGRIAARVAGVELECRAHQRRAAPDLRGSTGDPAEPKSGTPASPTRDFREAHWESKPLSTQAWPLQSRIRVSEDAFTAAFAEAHYEIDANACAFTTEVRIERR